MMCAGLRNARGGGDAGAGLEKQKSQSCDLCLVLNLEILGGFCLNPCLFQGEQPGTPSEKSIFVLEKNCYYKYLQPKLSSSCEPFSLNV